MSNNKTLSGKLSCKDRLVGHVLALREPGAGVMKMLRGDNPTAPHLSTIFFFQELRKLSEGELKHAWEKARLEGIIGNDDTLRALGKGEHVICESKAFTCLIEVTKPRANLDVELLIGVIGKNHGIPVATLAGYVEKCRIPGTASLSKRVIEAT